MSFPPGDTIYNKNQSHWREFAFMHHQIQQAVEPKIGLNTVMINWRKIQQSLAENSRKRKPQLGKNNTIRPC